MKTYRQNIEQKELEMNAWTMIYWKYFGTIPYSTRKYSTGTIVSIFEKKLKIKERFVSVVPVRYGTAMYG